MASYTQRKLVDRIVTGLCIVAALLAIIPLGSVLFYVGKQGIGALNWDFFTKLPKPVGEAGGGRAGGGAGARRPRPAGGPTPDELLRLVPDALREGALALGVPKWRATLSIVLRTAAPGIATGVMLAVARVAGETAPLLFTAFGNLGWSDGLGSPTASLPVQIFNYSVSPYQDWHRQAWAAALVLVALVLFFNLLARLLVRDRQPAR